MIKTLISSTDATTGRTMCEVYIVTSPTHPQEETMLTYADITPIGTTFPLHITHWSVIPFFAPQGGSHHMLLESPAGSNAWKIPLRVLESEAQAKDSFNPPMIFSAGDELCLNDYSGGAQIANGASYTIQYIIGP